MKNVAEGYAYINVEGQTFELAPTLSNIAKIGTPAEIVMVAKRLSMGMFNITSYCDAMAVLKACGAPEHLYGGLQWSDKQNKTLVKPGVLPVSDVHVLAIHCIRHGVCGTDSVEESIDMPKAEPIKEFDAYVHINNAKENLELSLEEAEGLTMTKYIRLINAKIKVANKRNAEQNNVPTAEEQEAAYSAYEEMKKRADAKRKAALAAQNGG